MAVYGYVRVSTDKQELSVTAQAERIEAYCRFKDIELTDMFVDEDVSGGVELVNRPEGNKLVNFIRRGDSVVAVKLDRCFRNASDGISAIFAWEKRGVVLHLADNDTVADTSTATGFLTVSMQLVIAQYEKMIIGERTSQALKSAQAKGKLVTRPDRVPFGFELAEGAIIPCPEEERIMQEVVDLKDKFSIASNSSLAVELNDRGITLRGKPFNRHRVRRILSSHTD